MSQGTPINKLGNQGMNQEDSRLVDSILNDLNSSKPSTPPPPQPQPGSQPQPMSPEQHKMMMAQRQQQMMAQQQMMQQQMAQQKMKPPQSILDKLQENWKEVLSVVVLVVLINTSVVDGLFTMKDMTHFVSDGKLNVQASIIKALVVGSLFFLIKTQLD